MLRVRGFARMLDDVGIDQLAYRRKGPKVLTEIKVNLRIYQVTQKSSN